MLAELGEDLFPVCREPVVELRVALCERAEQLRTRHADKIEFRAKIVSYMHACIYARARA